MRRSRRKKYEMTSGMLDGFFSVFGLVDIPTKDEVDRIFESDPAENMRKDVAKVSMDFRRQCDRMREEVLLVE